MLSCHVAPLFQLPSFIPAFSSKRLLTHEKGSVTVKKKKKKPNQHTLPPKHHKMLTEKEREGDRE
jgi:hypothetical protein